MSRSDCRPARRALWGRSWEFAAGVGDAAGLSEGWGLLREGTASSRSPFTANLPGVIQNPVQVSGGPKSLCDELLGLGKSEH